MKNVMAGILFASACISLPASAAVSNNDKVIGPVVLAEAFDHLDRATEKATGHQLSLNEVLIVKRVISDVRSEQGGQILSLQCSPQNENTKPGASKVCRFNLLSSSGSSEREITVQLDAILQGGEVLAVTNVGIQ